MPNEIKPKRPLIGAHTLPTVWIYICVAFNLIGVLAVTMLVIAEIIILASNFTHYVDQYGQNYRWSTNHDETILS